MISDERHDTVCPLILNESEMTAGECITMTVFAEQYGVLSDKIAYDICYGKSWKIIACSILARFDSNGAVAVPTTYGDSKGQNGEKVYSIICINMCNGVNTIINT